MGVYYGRTYFGEEAKKDVVDIVKKIIETYKPRCAVAMHFANAWCHFPVSDEGKFMRLTGAKRLPNAVEVTKDAPVGCAVMAL